MSVHEHDPLDYATRCLWGLLGHAPVWDDVAFVWRTSSGRALGKPGNPDKLIAAIEALAWLSCPGSRDDVAAAKKPARCRIQFVPGVIRPPGERVRAGRCRLPAGHAGPHNFPFADEVDDV